MQRYIPGIFVFEWYRFNSLLVSILYEFGNVRRWHLFVPEIKHILYPVSSCLDHKIWPRIIVSRIGRYVDVTDGSFARVWSSRLDLVSSSLYTHQICSPHPSS